jgi:hypothetical protein
VALLALLLLVATLAALAIGTALWHAATAV